MVSTARNQLKEKPLKRAQFDICLAFFIQQNRREKNIRKARAPVPPSDGTGGKRGAIRP